MRRLSVVIPTKNEADNIAACIGAFAAWPGAERPEIIVVDNSSADRTRELASESGARVFVQGPERCAQRNRGWREAGGDYVLFLDADMIMPAETLAEIDALLERADPGTAFYIPERRVGSGLRLAARNFERSFYNATCIDGLRLIPRSLLEKCGGYDEALVACEDWDLDRRLAAAGAKVAICAHSLLHNEARQDLRKFLKKKAYYSTSVDAYRRKWGNDAICRRQFGLAYRYFGVFVEKDKWRKVLAHPLLFAVMMLERVAVGVVYLVNR